MLPQASNFLVSWSDLGYQVQPSASSHDSRWDKFEKKCKRNLIRVQKAMFCGKIERYDLDNHEKKPSSEISILRRLNGSYKSGELTGILGPSGAGKTSLLNFLARRRVKGYSGSLEVSGTDRQLKISTIPQDNYLPDYLTVEENLLYASRLNNCHKSIREHREDCARVAQLLGIDRCLDVQTKSISGGQHKRLSIAQELLTKPDILILDEPTSGLDSLTCLKTISVLKDLVVSSQRGLINPIAIVLTIHQPPQDVFNLFDKVYVMAGGGKAIYDGPPSLCATHITDCTGIELPYSGYNHATFAVDIASGKHGQEPIDKLEQQTWSRNKRKTIDPAIKLRKQSESNLEHNSSTFYIDQRLNSSPASTGNFIKKTMILSSRYWKSIWREPKFLLMIVYHIILPIVMSLIIGSEPGKSKACPKFKSQYSMLDIVDKSDTLASDSVQDELYLTFENVCLIYMTLYGVTTVNIASATLSFVLDLRTSLTEQHNGWYSMSSYLLARLITDIPSAVILPILSVSIFYPLSNQLYEMDLISDAYRIWITSLAAILGVVGFQVLGMIVGAFYLRDLTTAMFVSQGITLPMTFLSGFIVRVKNMSNFVYVLSFTSIYRHMIEIAVVTRYGYNVCRCNSTEITGEDPEMIGVPDKLRRFTKELIGTSDEEGTSVPQDVFSTLAKQISLYNSYGVEIKSCANVRPHQMDEFSLSEDDIPIAFLSLLIIIVVLVTVLFTTVKILTKSKGCL